MTDTPNTSSTSSCPACGRWHLLAGALAILFGIPTLIEGGHVLFGQEATRDAAGAFVPFVVTFNFIAGFFYIATGLGTLLRQPWVVWAARALALGTALVFVAFGVHALSGGDFMGRTVGAMTIRTVFWTAQALLLPRLLRAVRPRSQ